MWLLGLDGERAPVLVLVLALVHVRAEPGGPNRRVVSAVRRGDVTQADIGGSWCVLSLFKRVKKGQNMRQRTAKSSTAPSLHPTEISEGAEE